MAKKGFTLIEILIVVTLIGILVAILIPQYKYSVLRAKEAVLKENLFQVRDAINKYYFDKKKYPSALEDLVTARYLREVPFDPDRQEARVAAGHGRARGGRGIRPRGSPGRHRRQEPFPGQLPGRHPVCRVVSP